MKLRSSTLKEEKEQLLQVPKVILQRPTGKSKSQCSFDFGFLDQVDQQIDHSATLTSPTSYKHLTFGTSPIDKKDEQDLPRCSPSSTIFTHQPTSQSFDSEAEFPFEKQCTPAPDSPRYSPSSPISTQQSISDSSVFHIEFPIGEGTPKPCSPRYSSSTPILIQQSTSDEPEFHAEFPIGKKSTPEPDSPRYSPSSPISTQQSTSRNSEFHAKFPFGNEDTPEPGSPRYSASSPFSAQQSTLTAQNTANDYNPSLYGSSSTSRDSFYKFTEPPKSPSEVSSVFSTASLQQESAIHSANLSDVVSTGYSPPSSPAIHRVAPPRSPTLYQQFSCPWRFVPPPFIRPTIPDFFENSEEEDNFYASDYTAEEIDGVDLTMHPYSVIGHYGPKTNVFFSVENFFVEKLWF